MLNDCGYNTNLINDMRKGKMPSADKIMRISKYLGVSVEYLMGEEENSAPADSAVNSEFQNRVEIAQLLAEYGKMSEKKRKQLMEYAKFLKMQEEFSKELEDFGEDVSDMLAKEQLQSQEN